MVYHGWTLQELLAPPLAEFFCSKGNPLGDKMLLEPLITLRGKPLSEFSVTQQMSWAETRETRREEDKAYSLLGIFNIHMPLIYSEGAANAFPQLPEEIDKCANSIQNKVGSHSGPFSGKVRLSINSGGNPLVSELHTKYPSRYWE
jgi:hypothetical protein